MKRLIFLLLTTTFLIISFLSVKQFEFLQFQSFNYHNNEEKWNINIEEGNAERNRLENYQLLTEAARKAKVNLQRISYERNNDNKDKIVYYVTFYASDTYFEETNLKLKNGNLLDENSNANDFLSTVQTKNKHQIGQLEIFHSFDPIEIRPMIAAEKTKDIKGVYTLNNKDKAKRFKKIATDYGFLVTISNQQNETYFTNYPYQDMIYIVTFVLCLLILLAMLYDIVKEYKSIGVRYMLGDAPLHILIYLFLRYTKIILWSLFVMIIGLVIFLYYYNQYQQFLPFLNFWFENIKLILFIIVIIILLAWIGTKSIHISQMIKNKKPVKLIFFMNIFVRLILAVFLTLGLQQVVGTFQELKSASNQQEKWEILKEYSYLGVINEQEFLDFQSEEKRDRFRQFYRELESNGAFYISPSIFYLNPELKNKNQDQDLNTNPWGMEGRKVEVDKNYLLINPIYGIDNKQVKISKPNENEIIVLVPQKYQKHQEAIEEVISRDYHGAFNLNDPKAVNVNIIYVKDDQSYFSFSPQMAAENNYYITDPIAVVVNYKFDPVLLSNTISRGYGYYTKNSSEHNPFKDTNEALTKYKLDNTWETVSIAYSSVEQKIENNKEALQLTTIYCIIFLILTAVLLFFSAMFYIEMNKQLLALQWIFGYRFHEKHLFVYLSILVFWYLSFMICYSILNSLSLLMMITIVLLCFDVILVSIIFLTKEFKITKQILIEK
ncbi:hypothetical protein JUJ52_02815 [Virgibacillus sp. AGTR]|uniref:hypothetical protein n=1 Tax=Virgibacillus sp. AGTR TaxID=2812055 RepID=UPI001D16DDF3|nr:hypothetical protein [Virgibacillus sp. AGTR]MCC2248889.1 hypothetical protein [Virgibacillus sp. AGTR]